MRDMSESDYFVNLKTYIDEIEPDNKADEITYENRLNICKECDNLVSGMCTKCGCYVELRAAVKKGYCPDVEARW